MRCTLSYLSGYLDTMLPLIDDTSRETVSGVVCRRCSQTGSDSVDTDMPLKCHKTHRTQIHVEL